MLIELILDAIYSIMSLMLTPLNIPDLPPEALEYVNTMFDYLQAGAGVVANYAPLGYMLTLFAVILAIDVGIKLYHFVMWIIKKIPMLSMS